MLPNQPRGPPLALYLLASPPPAPICAPLTRLDTRMRERKREPEARDRVENGRLAPDHTHGSTV